jgi:DNA-binding CsgD family transcriptional regulator
VKVAQRHLIGRDEELQGLVTLLDTPEAFPRAAVLAGDAGIGKTALWFAALEAAAARDYRVVSSRPAETETGFSFVGLADLVGDTLAETLPELSPPQRRALEQALLLDDADGAPVDERGVAVAFLNTIRTLASEQPLVIAVDDVQWLDAPSLAIMSFALARLRDEAVAVLLTCRGQLPDPLRRALPEERLVYIDVGPLSLGALHELLRDRLGSPFGRPALVRLWETSGGNPFFALELARALERRGGRVDPSDGLLLPDNLEELVQERLEGLTPAAMEVARVVAMLAEPTARRVEEALDAAGASGLDDALGAGLLELDGKRIRFSHPLLASALNARTPLEAKRAIHSRLATLALDEEERARHLALAASGPDAAVADLLETAARRARSRGAAAAAADLAQQALRLTPEVDRDTIRGRTLEAADHVYVAGDSAHAIELLEQALADVPDGPARAAILRQLGYVRSYATGPIGAVALLREALSQCEGDDALEAAIASELAEAVRLSSGLVDAEPFAEAAVRAAARAGDDAQLLSALAAQARIHFKLGRGVPREVMARATALEKSLGLPPTDWTLKGVICDQLFWSHDLRGARAVAEGVAAALSGREDPLETDNLWYRALIEFRVGNWSSAAELADAVVALDEQTGRAGYQPVIEWPRAVIAAHRGHLAEAREWAEGGIAGAREASIKTAEAGHAWVIGFIELSAGRAEEAADLLRAARDLREAAGHGEPGQAWELPDLLDALVAVGELDEADAVVAPWEERARALDRWWALAIAGRCRALIRAAGGDFAGSFDLFERALADHERTEDPFQLARTLLALGSTQRRAKHRSAARETLERAFAIFEELGAPRWAEQTQAELGRIAGRSSAGEDLTPSEQRVAALVVEGLTNREVAAALFVGERTVETHLTHIYAKLGVRSRTGLAHKLR